MFSIFWPVKFVFGIFKFFLNLLVMLTCIFTVMALMGDKGWVWSLTTHFRMQYFIIQVAALVIGALSVMQRGKDKPRAGMENWLSIASLMFFAGLNLVVIAPYYLPNAQAANSEAKGHLKLMHSNLFGMINRNTDAVIAAIRDNQPDIVDLVEYTEPWQQRLEKSGVFRDYPYHITGRGHIGVYSKLPLSHARLLFTNATHKVANQGYIVAQVRVGGEPVTLIVAHPASPIMPSHLQMLQNTFRVWEKERPKLGRNLVIVGDLNTSPWSVEFQQLTQRTGLRDSQLGLGLQPSWPMLLPAIGIRNTPNFLTNLITIPIDHVLVSKQIVVLYRKTGPFVGSDHLPVFIELAVNKTLI